MYAKPKCPPLVKLLVIAVIAVELAFIAHFVWQRAGAQPGGEASEAEQAASAQAPAQTSSPQSGQERLTGGTGVISADGEGGAGTAAEPVTLTVSFAGDCTLGSDESFSGSRSFNGRYEDEGQDASYFLKNVAGLFAEDDLTVVNVEGALTDGGERADKDFAFKGDPAYAAILGGSGVEAASVANDHSNDYGEQGLADTIEALDAAGVTPFGFENIAYKDVKGVKVALVGVAALDEVNANYAQQLTDNIAKAKSDGARLVIAFMHWGLDREYVPTEVDMKLGRAAIDAGADVVVGSNPHVIQGWEVYQGRYIVYSLGNFCFGGNTNPEDKDCIIFQQTFTVTGDEVAKDDEVKFIPCSVSSTAERNDYQPTPAEGDEADRIAKKLQESTDEIAEMANELA